jgi:urea transport system ATP-binding protein
MLKVDSIYVSYGKSRVINGVSLNVDQGDKICLMGRNGVGKTSFLKSLIGILPVWEGRIVLEEKDITAAKAYQRSRLGLAYVPQGREIIPILTVRENLELGALAHNSKQTASRMEEVLEYLPALKTHLSRKGGFLSGGQQQQLAIGRALMSQPKILFLDEPSEGIQPNIVEEIAGILNRIHHEKGLTIFIVEQNLDFAFKVANKFHIMEKGAIVASGNAEDFTLEKVGKYLTV